ncbi:TPA: hypothetical protein ACGOVN_000957, partial [Streptococcus suis]
RAQEKMVHWTITRFLIFMLVKKQSIQGLNSPSNFRAHEKTTRRGNVIKLKLLLKFLLGRVFLFFDKVIN